MAACVRLKLVNLAVFVKRFGPGLERNRFHRRQRRPSAKICAIERQPESLLLRSDALGESFATALDNDLDGMIRAEHDALQHVLPRRVIDAIGANDLVVGLETAALGRRIGANKADDGGLVQERKDLMVNHEDASQQANGENDVHEWSGDGDAYQSSVALPTALTTIKVYETSHSTPPSSVLDDSQPYSVTARLMNRGASAQSSIGLVYNYRDASNFNEVTFAPAGTVQLREIRSGAAKTIAADGYQGGSKS